MLLGPHDLSSYYCTRIGTVQCTQLNSLPSIIFYATKKKKEVEAVWIDLQYNSALRLRGTVRCERVLPLVQYYQVYFILDNEGLSELLLSSALKSNLILHCTALQSSTLERKDVEENSIKSCSYQSSAIFQKVCDGRKINREQCNWI
jgi:hypothetical protein